MIQYNKSSNNTKENKQAKKNEEKMTHKVKQK
jgi:hypothetical protein